MTFIASTLMTLLMVTGVLLMFIVLLQRGRGGGLAGAFGGLGGQSAFGTKAGDVFTKITIVVAIIWVLLAAFAGLAMRRVSLLTGSNNTPPKNAQMSAGDDKGDTKDVETKEPAEDSDPFGPQPPANNAPKSTDPRTPAEDDPEKPVDALDPKSTDPKSTDPKSTDPKSTDPKSTDPKSTDPKPADVKPADEPASTDETGTGTKPKAADEKSATPDEPKPPAESKPPADDAPGDSTPE